MSWEFVVVVIVGTFIDRLKETDQSNSNKRSSIYLGWLWVLRLSGRGGNTGWEFIVIVIVIVIVSIEYSLRFRCGGTQSFRA